MLRRILSQKEGLRVWFLFDIARTDVIVIVKLITSKDVA